MKTDKDFSYYTYNVGKYISDDINNKDFKPYKADNKKLIWNVFVEDPNAHKIIPINLFEYNWVFLWDGLLYAKKHYSENFNKFADHIHNWLRHEYWSRTEYETIICGWPCKGYTQEDLDKFQEKINKVKKEFIEKGYDWEPSINIPYPNPNYKMDVYTQIMMNWDRFIEYVWSNKHLITKKKLGFE